MNIKDNLIEKLEKLENISHVLCELECSSVRVMLSEFKYHNAEPSEQDCILVDYLTDLFKEELNGIDGEDIECEACKGAGVFIGVDPDKDRIGCINCHATGKVKKEVITEFKCKTCKDKRGWPAQGGRYVRCQVCNSDAHTKADQIKTQFQHAAALKLIDEIESVCDSCVSFRNSGSIDNILKLIKQFKEGKS